MTIRVAVIGGGIAGLAAAWELVGPERPPTQVTVFEGGSRLGGKVQSEMFGGRMVDLGPDAFVARRPEGLALCRELGLEKELVAPGVGRAFVWARGRLRPLPAGLVLGVPTRLGPLVRSGICSPAGLLGPALDLLRPALAARRAPAGNGASHRDSGGDRDKDGESGPADRAVGEIVSRRLGREVAGQLAGPLIGGIHAGMIETMSAAAVFPALLEADGKGGSLMRALRAGMPPTPSPAATPSPMPSLAAAPVFLTLQGGLGRLVEALRAGLVERGVEFRLDSWVSGLERTTVGEVPGWSVWTEGAEHDAHGVVVAVPAWEAASLVRPHDQVLAESLQAISYSSVALVTMRFEAGAVGRPLDGTGFLVARGGGDGADPLVTACTWLGTKWPELGRPGDVLLRVSVGRDGDVRHESLDDEELVRRCVEELGPMMGLRGVPLETVVSRWRQAFPQYAVGHLAKVAALEGAAARLPALALAGAALHGVGIPACIGSGRRAAGAVLEALAVTPKPAP